MKQIEFFDIPSPCIGICQAGPRGYCIGCFRSREERRHWHGLEDDVKRKIIKACASRRQRAERARRRRAGKPVAEHQLVLWFDEGDNEQLPVKDVVAPNTEPKQ